jgi:hypothetical protein
MWRNNLAPRQAETQVTKMAAINQKCEQPLSLRLEHAEYEKD